MSENIQFVCFANSRKNLGSCIAGKSTVDKTWIRPVSNRHTHEITNNEQQYEDGEYPKLLDVISIMHKGHDLSRTHQKENYLLDEQNCWEKNGELPWDDISNWTDEPLSLWTNGYSSNDGINDRIPVGKEDGTSLYLIKIDNLKIRVFNYREERKVRGNFKYKNNIYDLKITDPLVENYFKDKSTGYYTVVDEELYACISLGDPFLGYFYKLIASVICEDGF